MAQGEPVHEVRTLTEYDADEHIAAMVFNSKPGVTTDSQTNVKFRFAYDAKGNRSQVIYPSGLVKQWSHTYETVAGQEALTRLVETQPSAVGAPATFRDTHYDDDGRLSYEFNGNGDRRTQYYNAADQLVQQIYTPANAAARMNVAYGYDADGRQPVSTPLHQPLPAVRRTAQSHQRDREFLEPGQAAFAPLQRD